ncbi:HPC2 multi-domain protein [Streptomyces sp. NPDC005795]|uniref:phage tail protein n=1 Tax=Streptomyces sp. NPDC005795 TaxID=3154677 RepID=UPI0033E30BE5
MKAVPEKAPTAPTRTDATPRTDEAAPAPVPSAPAPDRRSIQRLQRAAGNAAVSRLVAQRYTAPVKPSPAQAPAFRGMKATVAAKKTRIAVHLPAAAESKASQDAAVAPPDDKEAQGKAANAEKMNAAKPGEFDKRAFVDAVNKAIDAQAPKNLDEADKFSKSGKAEKVKAEVDGKVSDGKESSAKDIDTATKAPPDTSAAKDKPVTPLTPDQPPGNPGAPSAADAIPAKQPPAVTDFSEGPAANDKEMADAEVTEEQLAKSNEPDFNEALSAKKTAETDSEKAPEKGRSAESRQLTTAKAGAAASGAAAMTALTATRTQAGQKVDGGKGETKSKDEKKRAEVTAKLQKVYDGTKKDVETTLSDLDKKVDTAFTAGEKSARDAFTADHKRRMKKYKDKRYSGFTGKARWVKDKFAGLPKAANDLYQEARKLYVSQMQTVISSVADLIGAELGKAKARIAKGRKELKTEVDRLPADLKQFGEEAAKDFAGKFDDLEATVNEKSEQLVQDLASKYTAALNKIDEEIKKLQEANKGLIAKAKDAIVGVIKTINELKNLLLGILAKAAGAIMKIIKDPIGFLGNLVRAVGAGLNLFITNIAEHLKTGVVSWLLGTAVKAGLELPQKFDMKGIIQLIGSLLGLTWDNIKARVTRKGVPDEAMAAVETSVPVAKNIAREGPAGAAKEIQAEAGDLKATILQKLTSYLIPTVIIAGITWILSLLNPASAFIRAVKGIIDIVTFVVTQGAQIVEFVNSVLDAVVAIANGGQAGVPKMVEVALAASVPLLIGFLASLLGIGSLANKVKSVFHAVARPVNRAIDKIVGFIAKKGKDLWSKLKNKRHGGDDSPAGKQQRLDKAMRAAVTALGKFKDRPVGRAALNSVLAVIRRRYGLKSLSPVPTGQYWAVRGEVNPTDQQGTSAPVADQSEDETKREPLPEDITQAIPEVGHIFISNFVHPAWSRLIDKPSLGSGKLWSSTILNGTEETAIESLKGDAASLAKGFRKKHPQAKPNSSYDSVFWQYLFGTQGRVRQEFLRLAGGTEGALPQLKAVTGKPEVKEDAELLSTLEEMDFHPASRTHAPYGIWDPFPSTEKDADADLVAAINEQEKPQILNFLRNMVLHENVEKVNWETFVELWDNDSASRDFVKNRFRSVSDGMHEWIPTDQIKDVLESAITHHMKSTVRDGTNDALAWLALHHALRSSTNRVIWRIVDGQGRLSPGAHVGTFYDEKGKAAFTDGTVAFHDNLRKLYDEHKSGKASDFVAILIGILDKDKNALPGNVRLLWSGNITGLSRDQQLGARFRAGRGDLRELELGDLADRQEQAFNEIRDSFITVKTKIEKTEREG